MKRSSNPSPCQPFNPLTSPSPRTVVDVIGIVVEELVHIIQTRLVILKIVQNTFDGTVCVLRSEGREAYVAESDVSCAISVVKCHVHICEVVLDRQNLCMETWECGNRRIGLGHSTNTWSQLLSYYTNPDTIGPEESVLIREVSSFQGCPYRGVPLYINTTV